MEFKKCSINGVVYDGRSRNGRLGASTDSGLLSTGVSEDAPISPLQSSKSMFSFRAAWLEGVHESLGQREVHQSTTKLSIDPSDPPKDDTKSGKQSYNAGWFDPEINEYLVNPALGNSPHGTAVRDFMTLLSVCHTVLAEEKQDAAAEEKKNDVVETGSKPETAATDAPMVTGEQKADSPKVLAYKAQSPDEACLVTLAAEMGYIFKGREQNSDGEGSTIVVDAVGTELRYRLMHIIEFDSDRKRMSVIVRTPSIVPGKQGDVILFCKGADTVIFERLLPGQTDMVTRTTNHLERFAQDGR